jgi:uncharacterized protein
MSGQRERGLSMRAVQVNASASARETGIVCHVQKERRRNSQTHTVATREHNGSADVSDFRRDILEQRDHRPWPMPAGPWIMTQTWHDLLFAHWPIDRAELASRIPAGLELDLFDGQAWVGVVPFRMTNVAPRGIGPMPWVSAFPELNVRTYVRREGKPGVYFFSLDATSPVAVAAARVLFRLPYFAAAMTVDVRGDQVSYTSRRASRATPRAEFTADYAPRGAIFHARTGSLEHFLTERYCLYTVVSRQRVARVDIHHAPWPLQPADANIRVNTMADAAGIRLPGSAPLLHFAKRQDTVAWLPFPGSSHVPVLP